MKQTRKHYMPQEKVAVLRRHLLEKAPVWNLCQETGLHPSLFYHWLKEFFEYGTATFEHRSRGDKQQEVQQRRIAALEEKLKAKNEVLAELMEEHVALEKVLGRSEEPMGTPRHSRPGGGLGPPLAPEDRNLHPPLHRLVGG